MRIKIITLVFLIIILAQKAKAQDALVRDSLSQDIEIAPALIKRNFLKEQPSLQLSWQGAYVLPQSGTSSYINQSAFSPFGINFQYNLAQKYGFGAELSHHFINEKYERATYNYDGTIVSATNTRSLTWQPLQIFALRYLGKVEQTFRPFVYGGLGAMRIHYLNYWGIYEDPKKRIAPSLSAGLGFKLSMQGTDYWVIDGKVKYVIAPFRYDFINKVNYISLDLNIGLRWWPTEPD